jgi:hypothetical protein
VKLLPDRRFEHIDVIALHLVVHDNAHSRPILTLFHKASGLRNHTLAFSARAKVTHAAYGTKSHAAKGLVCLAIQQNPKMLTNNARITKSAKPPWRHAKKNQDQAPFNTSWDA